MPFHMRCLSSVAIQFVIRAPSEYNALDITVDALRNSCTPPQHTGFKQNERGKLAKPMEQQNLVEPPTREGNLPNKRKQTHAKRLDSVVGR